MEHTHNAVHTTKQHLQYGTDTTLSHYVGKEERTTTNVIVPNEISVIYISRFHRRFIAYIYSQYTSFIT